MVTTHMMLPVISILPFCIVLTGRASFKPIYLKIEFV